MIRARSQSARSLRPDGKPTAESVGPDTGSPTAAGELHRFVIQKHAARRLHYDLRLEIDGVLKSWAVPKGPPFVAGQKALAIEVEDHPLAYASFEGVIPAGHYGAGTVMVWDQGDYQLTADQSPGHAWRAGKIHFLLRGEKCRGAWTLVRMSPRQAKHTPWLLLKNRDGLQPALPAGEDRSVISGRTFGEI